MELALPRNEIAGPGLADLAKLKIKSLGLEHVSIRQNGISLEGCERLKRAMPKTVVFR